MEQKNGTGSMDTTGKNGDVELAVMLVNQTTIPSTV